MTTDPKFPYGIYNNPATFRLANFITKSEIDSDEPSSKELELLELLNPIMTAVDFEHLCQMLEICEVHICDHRICEDDQDNCAAGQGG